MNIKNNTWHFILAFLAMATEIPISFKLLALPFALWALVAWTFFVLMLAFWYEWRQAMDAAEVERHGGMDRFRVDSRDDVRKALAGIALGAVAGFLIFIFI